MSLPQVKQGLKFNGLTDYVSVPDSPLFRGFSAFTISTRVSNLTSADTGIVSKWTTTLGREYLFGITPTGFQLVIKLLGGSYSVSISYTPSANTDEITGMYDGSNLILYVNGVEAGRTTGLTGSVDSVIQPLEICRHDGTKYAKGKVSNIRVYNRALTADEVTANYNGHVTRNGIVGEWLLNEGTGTVATDTSGNGNNGTINGATWIIKKAPVKEKKNLLPPFSQWTLDSHAVVTEPYKMTLTATATNQFSYIDVPVLSSTQYTLAATMNTNSRMRLDSVDVNGAVQTVQAFTITSPITITMPSTGVKLRIYFSNDVTGAGTYTFTNPQLEKGSVPTTFEPYVPVPDNKPMPQKPKKNMLPPFTDWTLNANAVVTSPYALTLNATGTVQSSWVTINVLPNQTYTYSLTNGARIYVQDSQDLSYYANNATVNTFTFTTKSTTASVIVYVSSGSSGAGTYTFDKPQLELGSVATSFENYKLISDVKLVPLVPKKNMVPSFNSGSWTLPSTLNISDYSVMLDQVVGTPTITVPIIPGKQYTLSGLPISNSNGAGTCFIEVWQNGSFLAQVAQNGTPVTFTAGYDTVQIKLTHNTSGGSNYTFTNPQLEKGAVATPFESYKLVPDVKHI